MKGMKIGVGWLAAMPFLMVLFTVFAVDNSLGNGIVSAKYFWFYFSIVPVAIVSVLFFACSKKQSLRFTVQDGLVAAFALAVCFLTPADSGFSRKQSLLALIICLYFYFRVFLNTCKPAGFILVVGFIFTGLAESFIGLRQLYGWDASYHLLFKITGTFFNPGPYSGYVAITTPAALYYVLSDRRILKFRFCRRMLPFWLRWIISCGTLLGALLVLPASMSRAAWIGMAGGCSLVAVYHLLRDRQTKRYIHIHKRRLLGWGSGAVLFLLIAFAGMYLLKKDSADGRALIWKTAIPMIPEHPLGVGLGRFAGSYGDAQAAYFASGKATGQEEHVAGNPEYAFNEYIQVCVELGVIPFLLFLAIILYPFYSGIRMRRIATTGSLLALLLFAAMSYPFSALPFPVVLVFLLASNAPEKGFTSGVFVPVLAIALFVTAFCLKTAHPAYQAYKDWNQSKVLYQSGLYKEASNDYETLFPYLSDQIQFLFEYAQSLSKSEQYEKSNEVLEQAIQISCDPMLYNVMGKNHQARKNYPEAERCLLKATHMVPNRVYPYFLLANMYEEAGQHEKAKKMAEIVLVKEPKVNSTAIKEMRAKMKKLLENDF